MLNLPLKHRLNYSNLKSPSELLFVCVFLCDCLQVCRSQGGITSYALSQQSRPLHTLSSAISTPPGRSLVYQLVSLPSSLIFCSLRFASVLFSTVTNFVLHVFTVLLLMTRPRLHSLACQSLLLCHNPSHPVLDPHSCPLGPPQSCFALIKPQSLAVCSASQSSSSTYLQQLLIINNGIFMALDSCIVINPYRPLKWAPEVGNSESLIEIYYYTCVCIAASQ